MSRSLSFEEVSQSRYCYSHPSSALKHLVSVFLRHSPSCTINPYTIAYIPIRLWENMCNSWQGRGISRIVPERADQCFISDKRKGVLLFIFPLSKKWRWKQSRRALFQTTEYFYFFIIFLVALWKSLRFFCKYDKLLQEMVRFKRSEIIFSP